MTPNGQPAAFSQAEFDQREELTRRSGASWHPGRPAISGNFEMSVTQPDGSVWTERGEFLAAAATPSAPALAAPQQAAVGAPGVASAPEYLPLKRGMPAAYYQPAMSSNGQPAAFSQAEFDQRGELTRRSGASWYPGRPAISGSFETSVTRQDGSIWTQSGELLANPAR